MNLFRNKTTRALILIMCALVALGIIIAKSYYKNLNESIDPRIVDARLLYKQYDKYALNNEIDSVFILLDSIEAIYATIPHYHKSFELGVLNNNRAAAYLTLAMHSPVYSIDSVAQDSIIQLASQYSKVSIDIYNTWLAAYETLTETEIREKIKPDFVIGFEQIDAKKHNRILERRIKEIIDAQVETKRRLSVSYTNLGIIYRHNEEYEKAADSYETALELWDENLTAENNLNVLLGLPLKKRTLIQKLFPPEK